MAKKRKEPIVMVCRVCGQEFLTTNSRRVYCSLACNSIGYHENQRAHRRASKQSAVNKDCEKCGKRFTTTKLLRTLCTTCEKIEGKKIKQIRYQDIREHNAKNPLKNEWRGQKCISGRSALTTAKRAMIENHERAWYLQ